MKILTKTNSASYSGGLCKIVLTSLHDVYGSWHLYICHSLFAYSTFMSSEWLDRATVMGLHRFDYFYMHVASKILTPP